MQDARELHYQQNPEGRHEVQKTRLRVQKREQRIKIQVKSIRLREALGENCEHERVL